MTLLNKNVMSYFLPEVDAVMNSNDISSEAPLWQRMMTVTNMLGMAVYFSLLGLGFWAIKSLADDDGSKFST